MLKILKVSPIMTNGRGIIMNNLNTMATKETFIVYLHFVSALNCFL